MDWQPDLGDAVAAFSGPSRNADTFELGPEWKCLWQSAAGESIAPALRGQQRGGCLIVGPAYAARPDPASGKVTDTKVPPLDEASMLTGAPGGESEGGPSGGPTRPLTPINDVRLREVVSRGELA